MSKDLRKYAQQTTARLVIGFVLLLLVVGIGLIYFIYGQGAAMMGLLCLAGVLVPVVLIALALWGIDWIVKRSDQ
jgi:uncharacterized SAM-binding protein YcdF (DUF218 family)